MPYANGQWPDSALATIPGGQRLSKDAAKALIALDNYCWAKERRIVRVNGEGAAYRELGHPGDYPNGHFTQWFAWERHQHGGNLAAYPGSSNHGNAKAIDQLDRDLIDKYGASFGWSKSWSDAQTEPWHIVFSAANANKALIEKWYAAGPYGPKTAPTLKEGSHGKDVRDAQRILSYLLLAGERYFPYHVTGIYGPKTAKSVRLFQKAHGLKADGVVGPGTWKALKHALANQHGYHAPLKQGQQNLRVRQMQTKLKTLGFFPYRQTGVFGPKTAKSLRAFQRSVKLTPDGVLGPKTDAALSKAYYAKKDAGKNPPKPKPKPPVKKPVKPVPGPTRTSARGVKFIKDFEGFTNNGRPYKDGISNGQGGVWTIGYGHIEGVGPNSKPLTEPQASALLARDLTRKYELPVNRVAKRYRLAQHEYDALVSFVFNLGTSSLDGVSGFETMGRAIKSGNRKAIADAILLYDNPNDPAVHAGLKRRRQAERELFLHGKY